MLAKLNAFKADNPTMGEVSNPSTSADLMELEPGGRQMGWVWVLALKTSCSDAMSDLASRRSDFR